MKTKNLRKIQEVDTLGEPAVGGKQFDAEITHLNGKQKKKGVITTKRLEKANNWRDDTSLSFVKSDNDVLPQGDGKSIIITTTSDGAVWVIQPDGQQVKLTNEQLSQQQIESIAEVVNKAPTLNPNFQGQIFEQGQRVFSPRNRQTGITGCEISNAAVTVEKVANGAVSMQKLGGDVLSVLDALNSVTSRFPSHATPNVGPDGLSLNAITRTESGTRGGLPESNNSILTMRRATGIVQLALSSGGRLYFRASNTAADTWKQAINDADNQTVRGTKTFVTPPSTEANPTTANHIVRRGHLDAVVLHSPHNAAVVWGARWDIPEDIRNFRYLVARLDHWDTNIIIPVRTLDQHNGALLGSQFRMRADEAARGTQGHFVHLEVLDALSGANRERRALRFVGGGWRAWGGANTFAAFHPGSLTALWGYR